MIIPFLNDFEIPDELIAEWVATESEDPQFVEKQSIAYIRANHSWDKEIGAYFNGTDLSFAFGYHSRLEDEGFYYG